VSGEESTTPEERTADRADGNEGFVAREREQRQAKLNQLRERGIYPYPPRYDRARVGVLYASVEGFLKLLLIGGLLVPSVPSSNGAAPAATAAAPPSTPTASGDGT
jgi:hypothetical protein